jgi:acetyl-CoA carboxylase biotin carboxyl carrier protein
VALIELKADITGSIWKILKAGGDLVAEDEAVLIMESMKMEVPVSSPESGVIDAILVTKGQIVADGAVVARVRV